MIQLLGPKSVIGKTAASIATIIGMTAKMADATPSVSPFNYPSLNATSFLPPKPGPLVREQNNYPILFHIDPKTAEINFNPEEVINAVNEGRILNKHFNALLSIRYSLLLQQNIRFAQVSKLFKEKELRKINAGLLVPKDFKSGERSADKESSPVPDDKILPLPVPPEPAPPEPGENPKPKREFSLPDLTKAEIEQIEANTKKQVEENPANSIIAACNFFKGAHASNINLPNPTVEKLEFKDLRDQNLKYLFDEPIDLASDSFLSEYGLPIIASFEGDNLEVRSPEVHSYQLLPSVGNTVPRDEYFTFAVGTKGHENFQTYTFKVSDVSQMLIILTDNKTSMIFPVKFK